MGLWKVVARLSFAVGTHRRGKAIDAENQLDCWNLSGSATEGADYRTGRCDWPIVTQDTEI
jgi:hypothetical protein